MLYIICTLLAFYYMDLLKLQERLKLLWYFSYNIYDRRKTNLNKFITKNNLNSMRWFYLPK